MTIRNLQSLFQPRSVALIGASQRIDSIGATVARNLAEGGFPGPVYPVNPKYSEVAGMKAYSNVAHLPQAPDLAIICTPPSTVPRLISELGARGTRAAIVLTTGMGRMHDVHTKSLQQAMLAAARPHLLRVLGPSCVGLLVPSIGLNASYAPANALPGRIAFVSQSGTLVTGVLDWARSRGIGFSKFISLGDSADVDVGDVLDYLAGDPATQAILLYLEDVGSARKFMSAARGAARNKPVLVIKAGRAPEGARAAATHSGALAGSDDVYDAAIRRAGMLRVFSTQDLFGAVETLAHARPAAGSRLAIVTNGGGPGVMATDALIAGGGQLAELTIASLDKLNALLPSTWSGANPVDIIADAPVERYRQALDIALADSETDAVLLIHAPTAIVPSAQIAAALAPVVKQSSRTVLSCWLGGNAVVEARRSFAEAGIPAYSTPEAAVHGFLQLVQYRRNQALLMRVPPSVPAGFTTDPAAARALVRKAVRDGRCVLTEPESKAVLAAYGIPVVDTRVAADVEEAVRCSEQIGYPVALKVLSADITHKSDVGGVALDLESADDVRHAAAAMGVRLRQLKPDARLQGFSVQAMARRPNGIELIAGINVDPVFGPVILFGQGGVTVEAIGDHALALPPLDMVLARDLVDRTRVRKVLAGYRNRPAADVEAICRTLVQLAHLAADLPEVVELDINPLLADSSGVIALDARIRVDAQAGMRFAIRPYPKELEQIVPWQERDVLLRPVRPEDGQAYLAFFDALDREDVRCRMFIGMRELPPSQLARLTQIDYDRELAFLAVYADGDESNILGEARVVFDPDNAEAEFALIVRSDIKGHGLGEMLMNKLIECCRERGTLRIVGEALRHNRRMLRLAASLGFQVAPLAGEGTMSMRLDLTPVIIQAGHERPS